LAAKPVRDRRCRRGWTSTRRGLHLNRCRYILITTVTPIEGREVVQACTMITEGILEYGFEPTTTISRLAASGATGTCLAMTLMKALHARAMATMT